MTVAGLDDVLFALALEAVALGLSDADVLRLLRDDAPGRAKLTTG